MPLEEIFFLTRGGCFYCLLLLLAQNFWARRYIKLIVIVVVVVKSRLQVNKRARARPHMEPHTMKQRQQQQHHLASLSLANKEKNFYFFLFFANFKISDPLKNQSDCFAFKVKNPSELSYSVLCFLVGLLARVQQK